MTAENEEHLAAQSEEARAVELLNRLGYLSVARLQRELGLRYGAAVQLMTRLMAKGVVRKGESFRYERPT